MKGGDGLSRLGAARSLSFKAASAVIARYDCFCEGSSRRMLFLVHEVVVNPT